MSSNRKFEPAHECIEAERSSLIFRVSATRLGCRTAVKQAMVTALCVVEVPRAVDYLLYVRYDIDEKHYWVLPSLRHQHSLTPSY
jgi:hypothetical protein